jgi:hypothetical protein
MIGGGFVEYGLATLMAFGFVNLILAQLFLADTPPIPKDERERRVAWQGSEDRKSGDEADLETPAADQEALAA